MSGDGLSVEKLYITNVLSNLGKLLDKLIKTSFQEKKGFSHVSLASLAFFFFFWQENKDERLSSPDKRSLLLFIYSLVAVYN